MSALEPKRMPIGFVAHGSPMLALDAVKGAELRAWAEAMPKPRAIVIVSAHWQTRDPTIGATTTLPLLYDFSGFDPALNTIRYAPPGAPDVAARVEKLLAKVTIGKSPDRKLDHGVWVPLLHMFPAADVPVLQLSLPRREPAELFDLGRALAPLADEAVLFLGSGVLVHNLRSIDLTGHAASRLRRARRLSRARAQAGDGPSDRGALPPAARRSGRGKRAIARSVVPGRGLRVRLAQPALRSVRVIAPAVR